MSAKPEPPQGADLHALKTGGAETKRKRQSEGRIVRSVAAGMAGEVIAAVAGQGRKDRDGED